MEEEEKKRIGVPIRDGESRVLMKGSHAGPGPLLKGMESLAVIAAN